MARTPDSMVRINIKLAVGGWISVCRVNAERLVLNPSIEVQVKHFLRSWGPMDDSYTYRVRTQFRARQRLTEE